MRAVIQRVNQASVSVDGTTVGAIQRGLLVFLGIQADDDADQRQWLAQKLPRIRCFEDADGRMNLSVADIAGDLLIISQFTLFGELRKGTRPSYNRAAGPAIAMAQYLAFVDDLRATYSGGTIATGTFAAHMQIDAQHDGPVTLILDTRIKNF